MDVGKGFIRSLYSGMSTDIALRLHAMDVEDQTWIGTPYDIGWTRGCSVHDLEWVCTSRPFFRKVCKRGRQCWYEFRSACWCWRDADWEDVPKHDKVNESRGEADCARKLTGSNLDMIHLCLRFGPELWTCHSPWQMVVGRLLSYWEGNFSGAMLNFRRVGMQYYPLDISLGFRRLLFWRAFFPGKDL